MIGDSAAGVDNSVWRRACAKHMTQTLQGSRSRLFPPITTRALSSSPLVGAGARAMGGSLVIGTTGRAVDWEGGLLEVEGVQDERSRARGVGYQGLPVCVCVCVCVTVCVP